MLLHWRYTHAHKDRKPIIDYLLRNRPEIKEEFMKNFLHKNYFYYLENMGAVLKVENKKVKFAVMH